MRIDKSKYKTIDEVRYNKTMDEVRYNVYGMKGPMPFKLVSRPSFKILPNVCVGKTKSNKRELKKREESNIRYENYTPKCYSRKDKEEANPRLGETKELTTFVLLVDPQ